MSMAREAQCSCLEYFEIEAVFEEIEFCKNMMVLLSHIRLCEHVCICYVFCQTMEVRLLYIFSFAPLS